MGKIIGIDLGIKHLAVDSNGFEYPNFLYAKRIYKIKNDFDKEC